MRDALAGICLMLDQFSETIGKIYASATDGSNWSDALAAVEELTGCAGAVVHIVPKKPEARLHTLLGNSAAGYFLAEHVAEWTRDYASLCPRLAAAERWPDAPYYVDYMLMSERELDRDPVYAWYGSYGLRYFIGSRLTDDEDADIVWSLQRRREQGHAQQSDIDLFELIKPHLARALRLARQLGTVDSLESVNWNVFEALPQALFALDLSGRVVFANAAATGLMRSGRGLAIADGRLRGLHANEQRALDRLIAEAARMELRANSGLCKISRPDGGPPLAVSVAPIRSHGPEELQRSVKVLVVVSDPTARLRVNEEMLTSLYGLTETESRLAAAIAVGHSLESASVAMHMRVGTARSHLKSIFAKLEVNRQQDLVGLLMSLSPIQV